MSHRRKLMFSGLVFLAALLAGELVLRLRAGGTGPASPAEERYRARRALLVAHYRALRNPLPLLQFEHQPGARSTLEGVDYTINSWGMRDREVPVAKPAGVRRVALLGDSLANGFQVPLESALPRTLERALATTGARWEVLNFAVDGLDLADEIRMLHFRAMPFAPDVAVFVLCPNDLGEPARVGQTGWSYHRVKERLLSRSKLLSGLDQLVHDRSPEALHGLGVRPLWDALEANVAFLARHAAHHRILPLVAFVPYEHQLTHPELDPRCQARLAAICARHGATFVDATPALRREQGKTLYPEPEESFLFPKDGVHPNALGHKVLGDVLARGIRERLPSAQPGGR